jgi:hypothetical protein
MVGVSPVRAQTSEPIDFEDHPANPSGLDPDFYADRGVRFGGGTVLAYDAGFAGSGTHALEVCYSSEFCNTPFRIGFDTPQRQVSVSVGYSGGLEEPSPVFMFAVDEEGTRLDDDEVVLGPGSPVAVGARLVADDPAGRIAAVEIRWRDATRYTDHLVVDDVVFEPAFVTLEADPNPLILESADAPGEIVVTNSGNVPALFSVELRESSAFQLGDTSCDEELAAGASCSIAIRFMPPEEGEHQALAVLSNADGNALLRVQILGRHVLIATTSTTEPLATTATTPTTLVPTTIAPSVGTTAVSPSDDPGGTPPAPPQPSEGGLDRTMMIFATLLLIVVVAVGGSALLVRMWRESSLRLPRGPVPLPITLRLTPGVAADQITRDGRRPISAIRVVRLGGVTTIVTEEDPT